MRVFLTGFMGSGKSTVGRCLAAKLGTLFIDLDREIEARSGRSIAEIFASDGEDLFRALEHEALKGSLRHQRAVVATGGGVPVFERNRRIMEEAGVSVWLDPPFQLIVDRMSADERRRRPLFEDEGRALSLFEQRKAAYGTAAIHLVLDAAETPADTAERIAQRLGGLSCAT